MGRRAWQGTRKEDQPRTREQGRTNAGARQFHERVDSPLSQLQVLGTPTMSQAANQSGVAVIGTGFIGPVHVEALRRAGQHVRGILGSSLARSQQAAQQLNIPVAYAS